MHLSDRLLQDVNQLNMINFEPGAFYVMNRSYIDFARLYRIHREVAYFITHPQVNQNLRRLYSHQTDKISGVLYDQTIRLNNFKSAKRYTDKLRRIMYQDSESSKTLEFINNNFELPATDIARLYKYHWKIELFFKWVKQHLKIKSFWGYSENAVRIQVYSAIIAYTTLAILKHRCSLMHSIYEILQILSLNLLNKTPVYEPLTKAIRKP